MLNILASTLFALTSSASAATICEQVTTCEYTGYIYEECHINRRGREVCNIIQEQECTTELVCYEDAPLDQECYGIVDYDELIACLLG